MIIIKYQGGTVYVVMIQFLIPLIIIIPYYHLRNNNLFQKMHKINNKISNHFSIQFTKNHKF
jgi:hypothetical protein